MLITGATTKNDYKYTTTIKYDHEVVDETKLPGLSPDLGLNNSNWGEY